MTSEIKDNRFFPNGFESWVRTHHIVVTNMHVLAPYASDLAYDIGMKLTDEFELLNRGVEGKTYREYKSEILAYVTKSLPRFVSRPT